MNSLKLMTYAKEYTLQLVLLVAVGTVGYLSYDNSSKFNKVSTLEGGVQTCYQRVNQTFTAKIINDMSSVYLTQNFQSLTEECMAEGLLSAEEVLKKFDTQAFKKLTNLASSIHWFHEEILTNGAEALTNNKKTATSYSERFEKIETLKDEVFESTDAIKSKLTQFGNILNIAFAATLTLFAVSILIELLRQTKRRFSNSIRELEAQSELFEYATINSSRSFDIIKNSLEQNDLNFCSKLFTRIFESSINKENHKIMDKFHAPRAMQMISENDSKVDVERKVEQVWQSLENVVASESKSKSNSNSNSVSQLVEETLNFKDRKMNFSKENQSTFNKTSVINLETTVERVFDLFSDRVFKSGISIEMNMDPSLNIYFKSEELEQVVFQVLNNSITSLEMSKGTTKKLTINGIKLGSSVVLDVINTGTYQTKSIIDNQVIDQDGLDEMNLGLTICETFMQEFGGRVQFDTNLNSAGLRTGEIVKLVFKGAPVDTTQNVQARLVDVKVGTKKEILSQISI